MASIKDIFYRLVLKNTDAKKKLKETEKAFNGLEKEIKETEKANNNFLKNGVSGFGSFVTVINQSLSALSLVSGSIQSLISKVNELAKAYEVQESTEAKLNQILKATNYESGQTAESVKNLANELSNITKFGDELIISGQNLLLTFRNIGKDIFPEATKVMLDMSEAMGQDLQSSAIQLGKALNDPIQGITALSRVGVTFSETQKETIKTLQKNGEITKAQTVILEELKNQFGGVAKAAGQTLTGELQRLENASGDLDEQLGKVLLPSLIEIRKTFNQFRQELLSDPEKIESLKIAFKGLADTIINLSEVALSSIDTVAALSKAAAKFFNPQLMAELKKSREALFDQIVKENTAYYEQTGIWRELTEQQKALLGLENNYRESVEKTTEAVKEKNNALRNKAPSTDQDKEISSAEIDRINKILEYAKTGNEKIIEAEVSKFDEIRNAELDSLVDSTTAELARKEQINQILQQKGDEKQSIIDALYQNELISTELFESAITEIISQNEQKRREEEEKTSQKKAELVEEERKLEQQAASISESQAKRLIGATATTAKALAKSKKDQEAIAVNQTVANTVVGMSYALAKPIPDFLTAGIILAEGIAGIASIKSGSLGGSSGGSGGGNFGSGGGATIQATPTSVSTINQAVNSQNNSIISKQLADINNSVQAGTMALNDKDLSVTVNSSITPENISIANEQGIEERGF